MKVALVVAVAAVLALTGCVDPTPVSGATGTPKPTISPTATPTPTETAVSTTRAELRDLVLSAEGLGPIVLGSAMPSFNPGTDLVTWTEDFCGYGSSYANWETSFPLTSDGKWPFLAEVTYDGGTPASPVTHISVQSVDIRTIDGLGIGSSVAQLQFVYGADLKTASYADFIPYWVEGSSGVLVFWVAETDPTDVATMEVMSGFSVPQFSYTVSGCA